MALGLLVLLPLFTFAAFIGAAATPESNGVLGAIIALLGVFLSGFLLLIGTLTHRNRLRAWPEARSVTAGVNAAVVGVLAAALYNPVFAAEVTNTFDLALAAAAFFAIQVWKTPA